MNNPKVLVATDFSADSEFAMQQARAYAVMAKATLLIVHVVPRPAIGDGEGMLHGGAYADSTAEVAMRLRATAEGVTDVECTHRLLYGEPAAAILDVAKSENVRMIVMGTHGRTGIARVLMGSVAEQVVRGAACSVMIVKTPRSEHAA
ncbi:MAG: universal stress protein [Phycisphaerales bacterium]|nr:universal stress protein [Phycisphaerales bacterium]MCB9856477.1 universal stress protein [Phycisphaerales bacterium]MCB9863958.1 universal stress protein [Phycisphaerales bacterium]